MRQEGHWEGGSAELEVLTRDHVRAGGAWELRPMEGGQMGHPHRVTHRVMGLQEGPGSDPALLIPETVSVYKWHGKTVIILRGQ